MNSPEITKPILLVEDDPDDVFLFEAAFARSGVPHKLHITRDGLEAVSYLSGDGPYHDRSKFPLPYVVFVDIKMPKMDGHEVVKWIRSQPHLADLPVVMLTTSKSPLDIQKAYQMGANSFLRKGDGMTDLRTVLKVWLNHNMQIKDGSKRWDSVKKLSS